MRLILLKLLLEELDVSYSSYMKDPVDINEDPNYWVIS
jgi:hypothetical protein